MKMWRYHGGLRNPERQSAWIRTIVHREVLRQRTRRKDEPLEDREAVADEDWQVASTPERLDMSKALAELAPAERLLVRLRYEEDLTQPAIARLLAIPEGTVKVRLHRARTKLRHAYEADDHRSTSD
jgi:RNA polymerase sigma-70 factor, ECF subfamily